VPLPVPAGTTAEVRSLPPRNVSFLGREKELLEIEEGLTAHNSLVIQAAEQPQFARRSVHATGDRGHRLDPGRQTRRSR
jgi:hypothetical protein